MRHSIPRADGPRSLSSPENSTKVHISQSVSLAGTVGTAYAAVLGFALVYLGEHYVVDLLGGLALTLAVRRAERLAARPVRAIGA